MKDIHRYLAWVLHAEAETGKGRANGRIATTDLKKLLEKYLEREKHDPAIVEEIFGAVLERVVMIVSRVEDTYEFEVQPLREYFAARYLYDTAPYSPPGRESGGTKPDRFDAIARNFYWLNVTRFFCGCFSKGELLDLSDRVKELAVDPTLGRTRHPITLAAMLSSDWVFAQAPRAVIEIAGALSSREAIRKLLPMRGHYTGSDTIQIPPECGGSTVVENAFAMLEDQHTRVDLGFRLSEFIRANLTPSAVDARWVDGAKGLLASDTKRWLWVGYQVGALERVHRADILRVLGTDTFHKKTIAQLAAAGRYDCALTSDTNAAMLASHILDDPTRLLQDSKAVAPLYILPDFLSMTSSWLIGRAFFVHEPVLEAAERFDVLSNSQIEVLSLMPSGFEQQALSISKKISVIIKAINEGSTHTSGLEEIIEDCKKAWGERKAIVAAACGIVQFPRASRHRLKPVSLSDSAKPLCERLRYAKSRLKDTAWWTEQLHRTRHADDRFLFNLAYWTWASSAVVGSMADMMADALDQLDEVEWFTLLDFMQPFVLRTPRTRDSDLPKIQLSEIPSARLALLIAFKQPLSLGRPIFLSHFLHSGDEHRSVAEFRQAMAFDAALAGELEWRSALYIIRSTYAEGAWAQIMRITAESPRRARLPEAIVQQVLRAQRDYPVHLCELAELDIATRARKEIRAVAMRAKKERWFST